MFVCSGKKMDSLQFRLKSVNVIHKRLLVNQLWELSLAIYKLHHLGGKTGQSYVNVMCSGKAA